MISDSPGHLPTNEATYPIDHSRMFTSASMDISASDLRADTRISQYQNLQQFREVLTRHLTTSAVIEIFARANELTGNAVTLDPQFAHIPILLDSNDEPVLLYELVEALEQYTDYGRLHAEFPTLTYGQIAGALSFLRKLAQFNSRSIDVDDLEDEMLEATPEFQAIIERAVEEAVGDEEGLRVLNMVHQDGR